MMVQLTETEQENQALEPFYFSPYVKKKLLVGKDVIDIDPPQEAYPHLRFLDTNFMLWKQRDDTWTGYVSCSLLVGVFCY